MDGNKDEALKCLKIGKEALEQGDRSRALKFISKARRLDPNLEVDDLLGSLNGESSSNPTASDSSSVQNDGDEASSKKKEPIGIPSLRKRAPLNGSSSSSTAPKEYTQEQISIVRQIKKQKDYYEILGVEKESSVEDVRKAYRKLSLKVHPDKNSAPGAEEAFKAVSKAFQCLSNEESRKKYDVSGTEEIVYERGTTRRGHHHQGFNGFYEAEFDADEIFRNFFYGGGPRATTQFGGFTFATNMGPSVRTANNHGSSTSNLRACIQLLPVLLVILLNFLPSNDPIYSLSRSYPYEHRFSTMRGVDYFVKTEKFEQQYPPSSQERFRLEVQIDREYYGIVSQNCRLEMQRRNWGLTHETPHCELLKQFNAGGS
ncbi:Chaperone protein dnaj [Thalictrum thalictroides]|uniref:Chaperone protein dnaj n=1 Tax=Thalictrum thalictroides TaxID=46969 RepID=A0A7J6VQZ0_THATH|nr:Chaperone protein dnaj [Thalictrum thalictroides]